MKNNTMNRKARQLLALLLSVVMLVSVFSATGLSLVFAAGENYASVAFGDNFMLTTGMNNPEGLEGNAVGGGTTYHDEGGTPGTSGHTVLGSELGLTGEYADRYALKMDSSNDRLMMQIPDGTFVDGTQVTVTLVAYFPNNVSYNGNGLTQVAIGVGGASPEEKKGVLANDSTGEVDQYTTSYDASEINGKEFWAIYHFGDNANNNAYVFGVTFTTENSPTVYTVATNQSTNGTAYVVQAGNNAVAEVVPNNGAPAFDGWYVNGEKVSAANPYQFTLTENTVLTPVFEGEESETTTEYASISFAGDTITTVNGNILHNHPDAFDEEADNGIYEVAAGTGIYGIKLSRQNEGFGFGIDNNSGFLSADKNVKLTVTYYAPSNAVQDNTRIPFQFSDKTWNIARVGESADVDISPLAKDELSSFTYILTEEEAAAVMANGNVFVHFYNYNDSAATGGDYLYVTEVRIEATDEEPPVVPEEPEEPAAEYSSMSFENDQINHVNSGIHYNHPDEDDAEGNGIFEVAEGTGVYGLMLSQQNRGFGYTVLNMADWLDEGEELQMTIRYYAPSDGVQDNTRFGIRFTGDSGYDFRVGEDANYAASGFTKDEVSSFTLTLTAADVASIEADNNLFFYFWNHNDDAATGGDYLYITEVRFEGVIPEEPEEPTYLNYAAATIGDKFMLHTGMNAPQYYDSEQKNQVIDFAEDGYTFSAKELKLTGEYADAYALKMDTNNDRFMMTIPADTFAEGSAVTATVTYYFPTNGAYNNETRLALVERVTTTDGETSTTTSVEKASGKAENNLGSVKTFTYTFESGADVNGKLFWVIYFGDAGDTTDAYLLNVTFSAGDNTIATLTTESEANGETHAVQAGNEAAAIAVPHAGYTFDGWYNAEGTQVSTDEPYFLTLTADTTLTARFTAEGNYAAVAIGKDFLVSTGMASPENEVIGGWETFYHNANTTLPGAQVAGVNGISGFTVSCPEIGLTDAAYAEDYALKFISNNDRLIMHVADGTFDEDATVTATVTYYFPADSASNDSTRLALMASVTTVNDDQTTSTSLVERASGKAAGNLGSVQTFTYTFESAADVNDKIFWVIYYGDPDAETNAYLLDVSFSDGEQHTFATLTTEEVTGGDAHVVQAGNKVGVVALPDAGYEFVSWHAEDGAQVSIDNPYYYTLTEDSTITPHFTGYLLVLNTATDENGENPDATKYGTVTSNVESTAVVLTATPNTGVTFVGWYNEAGELLSAEREYTFQLTADMTITPRFRFEAGTNEMQEALDNAETWLVGYTPASQEAYRDALNEVRRLLEVADNPTAEEVATALSNLEAAEAGLTRADATTKGYAAIDFRSEAVLTYNISAHALNFNQANTTGHASFDGTHYGAALAYQNETIWVQPAADIFDAQKAVKVTVHYYYTDAANDAILNNERLGVVLDGEHLGTFQADGNANFNNNEVWVDEQEATLTIYLPDSTPLSERDLLQVARWMNLNQDSNGNAKMYIEAIEIETVDEVPGSIFVHIHPILNGAENAAAGGAIGGERQKDSVQSFTAVPNRGYKFVRWEAVDQPLEFVNGTNVNAQTMYLRMPSDANLAEMNLNVYFEALPSIEVVATSADTTLGTVEGAGIYYEGEDVVLKAIPQDGYAFAGWYVGDTRVSTDATWTLSASDLIANGTQPYTARFQPIVTAPMEFEDLSANAAINFASKQLVLTAGAGETASAVIVTDTVLADGQPLNAAGPHAVELTYYLDPYTKGATPNTDEIITLVVHDASTGADTTFTVQQNNGRDTSTDGVTQEAADSKLTKTIVKLPADFDVTADTLTLQYANGTEMHLLGAKMYWTEEPWRYLVFAPEAETITLPITILDYMPNGMLFEANMNDAPYNAFNLNPISIQEYADSLGIEFNNSSLVEDTLYEGHTVYKPFVSQYLVDKMLAPADDHEFFSNLISNLNNGNGFAVSGTQDGMDAWAALIEHIQAIRDEGTIGSWEATLQKLQGQNGARMYLKRVEGDATPYVETLYDAAYYMLNTLFISDSAYNKVVPELNALKLQAVGNGYYVFDSGYETVYNTTTGVIQNTTPISPNHTERMEGSADANEVANQFFPLNDLGYEDRVDMYGLTDRNFGFSLQGHGLFVYRADENQEFLFTGDDDVHLFINGVNVLSMDGLHGREFRQVSLNSMAEKAGLVDGNVYTFDFFFMERHTQRSNMKVYTNIEILPPNMEVEKNVYVDADYTEAYADVDEVDPFTKVYYEFVLNNDSESGAAIKNLQFLDSELGIELNALHEEAVLNPETAVTDLVFIIENSDGSIKEQHDYSKYQSENPGFTVADFTQYMREVFIEGLQVGETLRIRGIRHVVVQDITNVVSVVAEYTDASGETKLLAGEAEQTLTVIPGDHVVTVDYSEPLHVLDNRVFGHMERVQGLMSGTAGMVNSISVTSDAQGAYGTLEYIKSEISYLSNNWLQYSLNNEMAGEDSFTLNIESRYIRSGKASICLAKDAVINSTATPANGYLPNYNEGEDCIQNMHHTGARADFTVKNPAGYALLTLNYSNGTGSDAHFRLLVNETEVAASVTLPETGGWGDYREITFVLTFDTAGTSVISLCGLTEGFNIRELRLAEAEMAEEAYTYEKVITFVPANNIYYENELVTGGMLVAGSQGGNWAIDGTCANIGIDYENTTYGQGGNVAFNGKVGYSNGSALKGTGDGLNTKLSFTFTGTGVDIYSRTNANTGEIRVLLYEKNGDTEKLKKARYVDCEFYSGDLYQIPVVGFMDLPYGTYRVEVFVYPKGNEFTGDRDIFFLDGVRVYNPLGGGTVSPNGYTVYEEEGELGATFISLRETLASANGVGNLTGSIQGSVFYDYMIDDEGNKLEGNICAPADYNTYGPKNEVYLAPGQSIVFTVAGDYTGLQVAAKSANGTEGKMLVDGTEFTVSSTMDMYYRLNKEDNIYTITNTAEEGSGFILSLTKLKILNSNATFSIAETDMALASLVVNEDTIAYADAYLNGDFETAEKIAANATVTAPATGNESVKFEAALPQQHVEIVVESALGSYTVTEEAVISEIDVAAAELARDALIHSLLKAN